MMQSSHALGEIRITLNRRGRVENCGMEVRERHRLSNLTGEFDSLADDLDIWTIG